MHPERLDDFYCEKSAKRFSVVFEGTQGRTYFSTSELKKVVQMMSEMLHTVGARYSVIACAVHPSVYLPAIILSILKSHSSFTFLDLQEPLKALINIEKYVSVKALLVDESIANVFLLDGWIKCGTCSSLLLLHRHSNEQKASGTKSSSIKNIASSSTCTTVHSLNSEIKLDETDATGFYDCDSEKWDDQNTQQHTQTDSACTFGSKFHNFKKKEMHPDLAYIMQTSGTTGKPKVIQVPHSCIVPNITDFMSLFDLDSNDNILLCSPLTFDPSIIDIFLAIAADCTLVIVSPKIRSVPTKLKQIILENNISVMQATPSLILSLGDDFIKSILLSSNSVLKILAFGGEECPSYKKLGRWTSVGNKTRLFNLYGLTEVSCWSTVYEIKLNDSVHFENIPIGNKLSNTEIFTSNDGQLFVGGERRWCVVNDENYPEANTRKMRETGDFIATHLGAMYFQGRKDDIVKFMGKKLDLKVVRGVLDDYESIEHYVLYFKKESRKLYIFVVSSIAHTDRETAITQLRKRILNLPAVEWIEIPHIPLTKHGKSDVKKMMEYAETRAREPKYLNLNYSEVLSQLWKEYTIESNDIRDSDNFILQGGDSISAIQLASDIEWRLARTIPSLVDQLLNKTFKDVVELLKTSTLSEMDKVTRHKTDKSLSDYQIETAKFVEKKCSTECFQVSSRRGCFSRCSHSKKQKIQLFFKEIFKLNMQKCIDASPCIISICKEKSTLAFIGSHSGLFGCINVPEKNFRWTINLPDRIESSASLSECGEFVCVGCYDSHLFCMDADKGHVKWKFKTGGEIKCSPIVSSRNIVYFGSHDHYFYAVHVMNGTLVWKRKISNGSIFSSPCILEELSSICVATLNGVVTMLKLDSGDVIWRFELEKPLFSSPLVTPESIFIGSVDHRLLHFNMLGSLVGEFPTSGPIFSSPAKTSNGNIVFGCHDSYIYCISQSMVLQWKSRCNSPIYSSPCSFMWNGTNYIAVASTKGTIHILTEDTGKVHQSWNSDGEIFSSLVFLNGFLMFGCRDNYVYCYKIQEE